MWLRYGRENEVDVPLHLGGTAMRGLRRQVERARDDGVVISAIPASTPANAPLWDELAALDQRWLASRVRRFEVQRITRRYAPTLVTITCV